MINDRSHTYGIDYCREIENPKRKLYIRIKESYKIYIEDKEDIWVNMSNHPITQ